MVEEKKEQEEIEEEEKLGKETKKKKERVGKSHIDPKVKVEFRG